MIGIVALNEKLGCTTTPFLTAVAIVPAYSSGRCVKPPTNPLNLETKCDLDWNSVTTATIPSEAVTIQKKRFWMRRVQRQPPSWITPAKANITSPKKISHPLLVPACWPQLTSPGQSPIRPTETQSGVMPAVTTARPKNAFESNPAVVMQKTDT